MGEALIAAMVLVVVAWLLSRSERPGVERRPTSPDSFVGGSATWSASHPPTDAAGGVGPGVRPGGGPLTPAPADPIVDRIGDEQFIEGFVIGRHVTLAEQDRRWAQERAAFEAELPGDDAWLSHADGDGSVDDAGFGDGTGPDGFDDGTGLDDGSGFDGFDEGMGLDGFDEGMGLDDGSGFDGFDDDW